MKEIRKKYITAQPHEIGAQEKEYNFITEAKGK